MTPPKKTSWVEAATLVSLPRFQSKIDVTESCWLWTAAVSPGGYGVFMVKRSGRSRTFYAHRLNYAAHHQTDIPAGMVSDHLCRVRNCVNPLHIEIVTNRVNLARGLNGDLKETCPNGHDWQQFRVLRGNGDRYRCSLCVKERNDRLSRALAEAARSLGMTQQEYRERFGRSRQALGAWL